jgi:DNA polymerase-3 subunit epsilon
MQQLKNKLRYDIENLNFIALDVETANSSKSSICSLGLVTVKNGKIINSEEYLIKPKDLYFNLINTRIHGITAEQVRHSPEFVEIWKIIAPKILESLVIAHNTDYDIPAIQGALGQYGITKPQITHACTLRLCRYFFAKLSSHKLSHIADHLGFQLNHHNAQSDAETAAKIAIHTIPKVGIEAFNLENENITHNLR